MSAAGSYAVVENGDCLSVWKDGRFILSGCESGFYGTDLEKSGMSLPTGLENAGTFMILRARTISG